ncbi:MAG: hypothetical protein J7L51_01435, partial [Desulfurococcales archaeon]|nr:hypothetical protein [Desulfurococcales archaeon]
MLRISWWGIYIPRRAVDVDGMKLPAPSDDEDSITMAYEASSQLLGSVENKVGNVVVVSDDIDHIKLGVLLSLLDLSDV